MSTRTKLPVEPAARIAKIRRQGNLKKLVLELRDGALVECVLIPMRGHGEATIRYTLCVSTQVGCKMGCAFCATGDMGFVRDLEPDEIIAQTKAAEGLGCRPEKLVFMGMGEPLDNFDNWREAAVRLMVSRRIGDLRPMAYAASDMTVSTCGFLPGIERLAQDGFRRMILAVSINAPNDELRSRLMPINRRYGLVALREVLLRFPMRNRIFLAEYIVFRGLNDTREHARELAEYLRPFRACVNLIPYNPPQGARATDLVAPTAAEVERFRRWLGEDNQFARRRESKGRRVCAGCGQLATQSAGAA